MEIYTSYYGKFKEEQGRYVFVNIAVGHAKYFDYPVIDLPELYPDWDTMVKPYKDGLLSEEEYTMRYKAKLADVNKEEVINKLECISKEHHNRPIVLLCHCYPGHFCHRYIASDWLDCGVSELVSIWNPIGIIEDVDYGYSYA